VYEISYTAGDALPDTPVTWKEDGVLQNFTTGFTLKARVGQLDGLAGKFEKTSGFLTFATAPNVIIQWTNADLGTLPAGDYVVQLQAVETGGGARPLTLDFRLKIKKRVLAP